VALRINQSQDDSTKFSVYLPYKVRSKSVMQYRRYYYRTEGQTYMTKLAGFFGTHLKGKLQVSINLCSGISSTPDVMVTPP